MCCTLQGHNYGKSMIVPRKPQTQKTIQQNFGQSMFQTVHALWTSNTTNNSMICMYTPLVEIFKIITAIN